MILRLVAVALALTGVAGCLPIERPASEPTPSPLPTPLPKEHHQPAERPGDRDQDKLLTALAQVDACALLDQAKAKAPGFTAQAKYRRTAPHDCRIDENNRWVRVELGTEHHPRSEYSAQALAGVKAYQDHLDHDACRFFLPVSFKYAIEFYGNLSGDKDPCTTVAKFAAAAVPVLGGARKPATTALAGWTGCDALTELLGPGKQASYQFGSYPTHTVDGCQQTRLGRRITDASLHYAAELEPADFDRIEQVGAKRIGITEAETQCWVTWNEGLSGERDPRNKWVRIVVRSPDCATSKRYLGVLGPRLAGSPPRRGAAQKPLLYRPDQHDSEQPGACANLIITASTQRCEPYDPVDPPKGALEVYRRAKKDGHYACAISLEAARRQLGDEFKPVVNEYEQCIYVRPTHGLEVRVGVSDKFRRYSEARDLRLLGREAQVKSLDLPDQRSVHLSVLDQTGVVLDVDFRFSVPRGQKQELDTTLEERVEPLAQEILLKSF